MPLGEANLVERPRTHARYAVAAPRLCPYLYIVEQLVPGPRYVILGSSLPNGNIPAGPQEHFEPSVLVTLRMPGDPAEYLRVADRHPQSEMRGFGVTERCVQIFGDPVGVATDLLKDLLGAVADECPLFVELVRSQRLDSEVADGDRLLRSLLILMQVQWAVVETIDVDRVF